MIIHEELFVAFFIDHIYLCSNFGIFTATIESEHIEVTTVPDQRLISQP